VRPVARTALKWTRYGGPALVDHSRGANSQGAYSQEAFLPAVITTNRNLHLRERATTKVRELISEKARVGVRTVLSAIAASVLLLTFLAHVTRKEANVAPRSWISLTP